MFLDCFASLAKKQSVARAKITALGMMSRCPHMPKFGPQFAANGWDFARAQSNGAGVGGKWGE
jgi:hypothetical protein